MFTFVNWGILVRDNTEVIPRCHTQKTTMNTNHICSHLGPALRQFALALAAMAGLAIGSAHALTYSISGNGTNGYNQFSGEADGYKFTTGASMLVVSWLGFYDAPIDESGTLGDDLLDSHRVSIWRESDGVLMARTTVFPGDALVGNFRGRNVTPVVLAANTEYVIAADYGGQGDRMQEGNDLTGWALNGITIQEGRFNSAGGDMPTDSWNVMIGPNFGYDLATLSVSLTTPANNQGYPTGTPVIVSANVIEPGAFADTVTFHMTSINPPGSTVQTVSTDTGSPFTADLGTLPDGTYEIYATVANDNVPPDTATSATHTFTVAAAIQTTTELAAAGPAMIYGQNVIFTATVSPPPTGGTVQFYDGLSYLGDPVAVNTVTGVATCSTTTLGAGSRVINAEFSGHWLHETSGTITSITQEVGQAPLTVTAQDTFRFVNTANPDPLPYEITGFQNGQNLGSSGVTGTPVLSTTALLESPVGDYPITCAVGTLSADNYSFTVVDGTLSVIAETALAINVNLDDTVQPGLEGPGGGLSAVWNTIASSSATNLSHAISPTTTVGFSSSGTGGWIRPDTANFTPTLRLLKQGFVNFNANSPNTQQLVINGLDSAKTYDLYIASAILITTNQRSRGEWSTTNMTSTVGSQTVDNRLDQNGSTWVRGNNYVLFEDVKPDGSGNITVNGFAITEQPTYDIRLALNGFQLVESVPTGGFNAWANANDASGQTADQDHDNDGVENGIEYFMGETGSSFTAMPGLDGTNTVTWTMDTAYSGTYEVQTSPDLVNWTNVDPRPLPSDSSLSYLLPPGSGKQFVRLLVTPTP
jgi:hypothetical protein